MSTTYVFLPFYNRFPKLSQRTSFLVGTCIHGTKRFPESSGFILTVAGIKYEPEFIFICFYVIFETE